MSSDVRDISLGTDSQWEQILHHSTDLTETWRALNVRAHLSWPEDLVVNGQHKGQSMHWRIECYDNSIEKALGTISFQKDTAGAPGGIIILSLQQYGFEELWERARNGLLRSSTLRLSVAGLLLPDSEHGHRWLTSKAARLPILATEFRFSTG